MLFTLGLAGVDSKGISWSSLNVLWIEERLVGVDDREGLVPDGSKDEGADRRLYRPPDEKCRRFIDLCLDDGSFLDLLE